MPAGTLCSTAKVDLCIVGSDRTTATGDVANKIGTYLKALAAKDNGVPFYVALPFSTIDWSLKDGVAEIPIEERSTRELTHMRGRTAAGGFETVEIVAPGSPAANPAFDVTPGAPRDRAHHRTRRRRGQPGGPARALSRAGRGLMADEAELRVELVRVAQSLDRAGFYPSKSGSLCALA